MAPRAKTSGRSGAKLESLAAANARSRSRLIVLLALLAVLGAILIVAWPSAGPAPPTEEDDRRSVSEHKGPSGALAPRPAVRAARHRNTAPDVEFIGAERCVECHAGEHASFLHTPHSKALGRMGDTDEPSDGRFTHAASGIHGETRREGDRFRHSLKLLDAAGATLAEADFPVDYHIGSGNHSRSYLTSAGAFLFESPLTWYASRREWRLSPGYDGPLPRGFDRMVDYGCLVCHAGRIEMPGDNRFQARIVEGTIGCESCHGPGRLHAEAWRDRPRPEKLAIEDLTIVNPARLARDEAEQICAFCHLRGQATVVLRGRRLHDFRPGLMLADFRLDFVADAQGDDMKVTGHVEQMRRSRCYAESPEMTCITCHDPHARPEPAARAAYFRQKCVNCHDDRCGLPENQRKARQPADDCVACHMPRGDTDIPHFAFTHHRIGIHATDKSAPTPSPRGGFAPLVPTTSLAHLPEGDRLRSLGLAYAEYSEQQRRPDDARACRDQARVHLRQAYERGVRDAASLATLAGLEMELDRRDEAVRLARAALDSPAAGLGEHENARFVLANAFYERNELRAAEEQLVQIVRGRYRPEDWSLLAEVQQADGRMQAALESLLEASKYNPFRPDLQQQLSLAYARVGDRANSNRHRAVAARLIEILRSPRGPAPR